MMSGVMLTDFLLARLDEDERVARVAAARRSQIREGLRRWKPDGMSVRDDVGDLVVKHSWPNEIEHIARHDPARVLAEVAAKRRLLDIHEPHASESHGGPACWACGPGAFPWPCSTLRVLTLPHAEHPDYRQEWAP